VQTLVKTLTENQAILILPLGREARPFSNPTAKPAWVSPKLFNREKNRSQMVKVFYLLRSLTTHCKTCCQLSRPQSSCCLEDTGAAGSLLPMSNLSLYCLMF